MRLEELDNTIPLEDERFDIMDLSELSGEWAKTGPEYIFSTQSSQIPNQSSLFYTLFQKVQTQIQNQINILKKYDDDWDEEGAKQFNPEIFDDIYIIIESFYRYLNGYQKLLELSNLMPNILPNSDGSLDLSWRSPKKNIHVLCNLKIVDDNNRFISFAGKIKGKRFSFQNKYTQIDNQIGKTLASLI